MGFTLPDLSYNVEFTGHKVLDGLVVKVRGQSTDEMLNLAERTEIVAGGKQDGRTVRELLDLIAGMIVGWNLETDDHTPIPATREQLGKLDLANVVIPIIRGVIGSISGVSEELGKDLTSGESSDLALIPTETLSASPGS